MKGGVGATYFNGCDSKLKKLQELQTITLKAYNKETSLIHRKNYNYEDFCTFLKENDYGIKYFKTVHESELESQQILFFLKKMKQSFIDQFTCFASYIDESKNIFHIISIEHWNGIVFKNAQGSLKTQAVLAELQLDPLKNLREVYSRTEYFLRAIHYGKMYYGDVKCDNILFGQHNEVIIGDYGSIRSYHDRSSDLTMYTGTFYTPIEEGFIDYWLSGKGSKLSFIKKVNTYDSTIFSQKKLQKILDVWASLNVVKKDFRSIDDDDESYDSYYSYRLDKFYANAADWFHFGIALIEFIVLLNDDRLLPYTSIFFNRFCSIPMMNDVEYPFELIECLFNMKKI